jgi:trigger factor
LKVEYVEETQVRKALSFEIEPELVEKEIDSRSREYARKVKLPGFRPGKAPASVVRQRFREQVLEEVAEKIVNKVVFDELEGRGLRPLASPRVTDLRMDEGQPMTFRAVFEVLPLVELPVWRGLEVKGRAAEVKEEDVDREVDELRESAARYDAIEGRESRAGDYLLVDVERRTADAAAPQKDENVLFELGAERNHPDLNAALAGARPGDARQVRVVHEDKDAPLGARTIDYSFTVKGLKDKVVPAADDEFAKDLGEFESLAELREALRRRLQDAQERAVDREVKGALVERLVDMAGFEVPESLVERHMSARLEGTVRNLALQGVDPRRLEVDWAKVREGGREDAVKAAKAEIVLDEIARQEGIEVPEAEVEAELRRLAERTRRPLEAVRTQMQKEGSIQALRARIREERTLDLIKANARLAVE